MPQIDIDALTQQESSCRNPEFRLWLMVTIRAFETLMHGWGYLDMARSWIEDPENYFFEAVCEEMGFTADAMRERIREALRRSHSSRDVGPGEEIGQQDGQGNSSYLQNHFMEGL